MSLPQLQLPSYEVTLPASKVVVKYRPFVVREEKNLLLAIEEKKSDIILNAISEVISNCTFGKCDVKKMVPVDVEYLFVQIRNKALGEGVDIQYTCKDCNEKTAITINLNDVKIVQGTKVEPEIQLSPDLWVVMKYPTLESTYNLANSGEDDGFEAVARCIDTIITNDSSISSSDHTIAELADWVGGMTQDQIDKITTFFNSMPRMVYSQEVTCPKCNGKNVLEVEGLNDFFV